MVLSGGDRRAGEGDEVRKSKCERCQRRRGGEGGGGETFAGSPIAAPLIPETSVNAVSPGSLRCQTCHHGREGALWFMLCRLTYEV